jgi:hypothetical protein
MQNEQMIVGLFARKCTRVEEGAVEQGAHRSKLGRVLKKKKRAMQIECDQSISREKEEEHVHCRAKNHVTEVTREMIENEE